MHLHKSEPGGDHAPTKFSIAESQGERGACKKFISSSFLYLGVLWWKIKDLKKNWFLKKCFQS